MLTLWWRYEKLRAARGLRQEGKEPRDSSCLLSQATSATKQLFYSYETCGNLNDYSQERHTALLKGRTLRVTMPGDSGTGYTLVTHKPDGSLCPKGKCPWNMAASPRGGSFVTFMRELSKDAGILWKRVPIGNDSLAAGGGSSFTACAHMVALNETDLCIGNIWVTAKRLLIIPTFSAILYHDQMRLIVRITDEVGFWDKFWAPLQKTFSPGAWLLIACMVVFASLALVVVEGGAIVGYSGDSMDDMLETMDEKEEARKRSEEATLRKGVEEQAEEQKKHARAAHDLKMREGLPCPRLRCLLPDTLVSC